MGYCSHVKMSPSSTRTKYASAENLVKGAYVLIGADKPDVLLLATGSEVSVAT